MLSKFVAGAARAGSRTSLGFAELIKPSVISNQSARGLNTFGVMVGAAIAVAGQETQRFGNRKNNSNIGDNGHSIFLVGGAMMVISALACSPESRVKQEVEKEPKDPSRGR